MDFELFFPSQEADPDPVHDYHGASRRHDKKCKKRSSNKDGDPFDYPDPSYKQTSVNSECFNLSCYKKSRQKLRVVSDRNSRFHTHLHKRPIIKKSDFESYFKITKKQHKLWRMI